MKEEEILEILRKDDEDFRRLYQEHRELDNQLAELDKKHYLSPEEEIERKRMAKEKLHRKDKIAESVREYKKSHSLN